MWVPLAAVEVRAPGNPGGEMSNSGPRAGWLTLLLDTTGILDGEGSGTRVLMRVNAKVSET